MAKQKLNNKQISSSMDVVYLKQINNNFKYIAKLEQSDYERNKKEKYQVSTKTKYGDNNTGTTSKTKLNSARGNVLNGAVDILGNLVGFFSKIATALVLYKVVDWVGKSENKSKVVKLLKLTKGIIDFTVGFIDGCIKVIGGSVDTFIKLMSGTFSAFTGFFGMFYEFGSFLGKFSVDLGENFVTSIRSIPENFAKIQKNIETALFGGIDEAAETGVADAQKHISSSIVESARKDDKDAAKEPTDASEKIDASKAPKVITGDIPAKYKADHDKVNKESKTTDIPKLAKGGIVSNQSNRNIRPLSELSDFTKTDKLSNQVTDIIPEFTKLMKLPFTVIGTGIVSVLKSSIAQNPGGVDTVTPILNSISKLFNINVGDISTNTSTPEKSNNKIKTFNNSLLNEKYLDIFGKSTPNTSSVSSGSEFTSSNDTSIRGLLADILNAFTMKANMNAPKEVVKSNTPQKASGGWIHGPQTGYPVSLDGKKTDFIGHGTEWVGKHDNKSSAFVIPFDTPSTKSNKKLTSKRLQEASKAGYAMPEMAGGGELVNYTRPIDSDVKSSKFGMRTHPLTGQRRMHTGVDYRVSVGTPGTDLTTTTAPTDTKDWGKIGDSFKTLTQMLGMGSAKLPSKASGGELVQSNGWNDGIRLKTVTTIGGKNYKVAEPLAGRFKGFTDALENQGYGIYSIGGYNMRPNEKKNIKLGHPYGAAIDINPDENPYGNKLITDMPSNISELSKQFGLGWGGNWRSKKDAMHFSAMKNEGGDGYNGTEIVKGVLSKHQLPSRSEGGLVKANGFNNGIRLKELKTKNNKYYQVAAPLAPRFAGFVADLESTGYKIKNIGGYNPRENEDNGGGRYAHPYGAAIDINYKENPYGSKLITDMPSNVTQIAKKWGLGWGGNWRSKKDAMHFSAMIREQGDGFNGVEIGKGVLSGDSKDAFKTASSDTPGTPSSTSTSTPVQQQQQAPVEKDWTKIGDSFKTLTQMLGLGNTTDINKPKIIPITNPKLKALNDKPNVNRKPTTKQTIISSNVAGDNTNILSNTTVASVTFDFNSDAYRFTALGSMFGDVTSTVVGV